MSTRPTRAPDGREIYPGDVFVFGSNTAGRHGKGAAKTAAEHFGARYGDGHGRTGQSYAIPTKDSELNPLNLSDILQFVDAFLLYARINGHERFFVTAIGCGLAGYNAKQIGPMFADATENCILPPEFHEAIIQAADL